jgi:hypothetical protein
VLGVLDPTEGPTNWELRTFKAGWEATGEGAGHGDTGAWRDGEG